MYVCRVSNGSMLTIIICWYLLHKHTDPYIVKSSGESEAVDDLLYRAQSGRLPSEGTLIIYLLMWLTLMSLLPWSAVTRSSRHVATHHFRSAGGGGAGILGGAGMLLEDTPISIGSMHTVCDISDVSDVSVVVNVTAAGKHFALHDTPIRHVGSPSEVEGNVPCHSLPIACMVTLR